jgi:hypothetical protein
MREILSFQLMRQLSAALLLALLALSSARCSRAADEAPPVGTVAVTINRTTVPVGGVVDMTYRFEVAPDATPLDGDYLVFVHFLDDNGRLMWTDDHQPPSSTRQWKPGSIIEYTRTMFVPKVSYLGEATVLTGLYLMSSGDRLPLRGQAEGMRAYRVASLSLRQPTDTLFVVFKDGWHGAETSGDGSPIEWQWSRKEATLSFRNPRRDVTMYVQVDQPVRVWAEPQHVEIRLGQAVVDRFDVNPAEPQIRRIHLNGRQFGDAGTVEMVLAVDKTFVPASVPALRSVDHRELGLRVFGVHLEPR